MFVKKNAYCSGNGHEFLSPSGVSWYALLKPPLSMMEALSKLMA